MLRGQGAGMKPIVVHAVDHDANTHHLSNMSKALPGAFSWVYSPSVQYAVPTNLVLMDATSHFWTAFNEGLGASTMLYVSTGDYPEAPIPTVAQCFGITGSYVYEAIPMVINEQAAGSETKASAEAA